LLWQSASLLPFMILPQAAEALGLQKGGQVTTIVKSIKKAPFYAPRRGCVALLSYLNITRLNVTRNRAISSHPIRDSITVRTS